MSLTRNNIIIAISYLSFVFMTVYGIYTHKSVPSALSVFGVDNNTKYIFGGSVVILALILLYSQVNIEFNRGITKLLVIAIRFGVVISSLSLVVIAFVDMSSYIHNIFAIIYFAIMPFLAIMFGIVYRIRGGKTISKYLLIIGLSNLLSSLVLYIFVRNLLVIEILHTSFVFVYVFLLNKQK